MKSEQESERYSFICKLCGDSYNHKKKKQRRTRCLTCKEKQDWSNTANEPKWWPRFLGTKDNGRSKNARWTNYALSSFFLVLTILIFVAVGVGSEIAEKRAKESAATSTTTTATTIAPVATTTTLAKAQRYLNGAEDYVQEVRKLGGTTAAESDEYLFEIGIYFCDALDAGNSVAFMWQETQASTLSKGKKETVALIMAPAVIHLCPKYLTEMSEFIATLK
jgi:hypothetical protein